MFKALPVKLFGVLTSTQHVYGGFWYVLVFLAEDPSTIQLSYAYGVEFGRHPFPLFCQGAAFVCCPFDMLTPNDTNALFACIKARKVELRAEVLLYSNYAFACHCLL